MTTQARHSAIRLGTLALGVAVFAGALYYINVKTTIETVRRLGLALPLAIVLSGLWHLVRTWAWAACFPQPRQVGFLRLARVRLVREAFSYLTLRGIAGEPLKVVLLSGSVDARQATAAIALERLAYLVGTTIIVGVGAVCALISLPLTPLWFRVFRAFAIGSATLTVLPIVVVLGRGAYFQSLLRRIDHALGASLGEGRVARFLAAVERQMLDLVRGNPRRLLVLMSTTAAAYVLMALEGVGDSAGVRCADDADRRARHRDVCRASRASRRPSSRRISARSRCRASRRSRPLGRRAVARPSRSLDASADCSGPAWGWQSIRARFGRPSMAPTSTRRRVDLARRCCTFQTIRLSRCRRRRPLAGLPIAERVIRAAVRAGYSRVVVWAPESAQRGPFARLLRRLAPSWAAGSSWPPYRANGVPRWHRSIPPTP